MKVAACITINCPLEIVFAALIDVPHHTDWAEGPIALLSFSGAPIQPGTTWTRRIRILGREMVTSNTCNVFEANRTFGWQSGEPLTAQSTFSLERVPVGTEVTWTVQSDAVRAFQLARPLVARRLKDAMTKSLNGLKVYLQAMGAIVPFSPLETMIV